MILVGRVQQLAYIVYACMPNFIGVHMILDMHRMTCSFFPYDFLSFQHFSGSDNFILFKTLLLYVCPLFVLGRDFFKEKVVNAYNYRFFWKGPCFNYLISTLWLGFNAGLFEGNLFWVCQYAGL